MGLGLDEDGDVGKNIWRRGNVGELGFLGVSCRFLNQIVQRVGNSKW